MHAVPSATGPLLAAGCRVIEPTAGGFAGAVLVGGRSRRMGIDKVGLAVGGRPLVEIVARALVSAGASPVLAIGRDAGPATASIDGWTADRWPDQGPLGGLITALGAVGEPVVAVLACDVPGAAPGEIVRLRAALGAADVAMTVADDVLQPLHAVWNVRVFDALVEGFEAGERSLCRLVRTLDVVTVAAVDPRDVSDVDTPEELRAFLGDG